jgi:hypothetical protein
VQKSQDGKSCLRSETLEKGYELAEEYPRKAFSHHKCESQMRLTANAGEATKKYQCSPSTKIRDGTDAKNATGKKVRIK